MKWRRDHPETRDKRNQLHRNWIDAHPGYERRASLKRALKRFGLTLERYDALLAQQGGVCAICKQVEANGHRLHIDHDHSCCPAGSSCGKCIRGLICERCNLVLGHVKDDPGILGAMALYLALNTLEVV